MQPSTILSIMAVSAASLVSASYSTNGRDSNAKGICLQGGLFGCGGFASRFPLARKPVKPTKPFVPTPPPQVCPEWKVEGSGFVSPQATTDGHCCVEDTKNALSCCHLKNIKPIFGTREMQCTAPTWQTVEKYTVFHECNTNKREPWECFHNGVPMFTEIRRLYHENPYFYPPKGVKPHRLIKTSRQGSKGQTPRRLTYTGLGPSPLGGNPNGGVPHTNVAQVIYKRGRLQRRASANPLLNDNDEENENFEDASEEPFKLVPVHVNRALQKASRKSKRTLDYTPPGKSRFAEHPNGNVEPSDHDVLQKRGNALAKFLLADSLIGSGPHRVVEGYDEPLETAAHRLKQKKPKAKPKLDYKPPGRSPLGDHPYGNPDPEDYQQVEKRSGRRNRSANPLLDAMSGSSRSTRKKKTTKKVPKAAAKALEESKTARRKPDPDWTPPGKSPLSKNPNGY
ncbi:hypothetical protein PspLS_10291 [Pyricularia sp. CBS 133598]|nr:hypothetical protein PspLS_10291 [Pyricularia sp. CBS 133598]